MKKLTLSEMVRAANKRVRIKLVPRKQPKLKTKVVTISFDVTLKSTTEKGFEVMKERLRQNVSIKIAGAGYNGVYSMSSLDGTTKVVEK